MPEPVVIIGPASGPAGPISGQPDSPASTDAAAVAAPEPAARTAEPPKKTAAIAAVAMVALRIVGIVLSLLQSAAWAIGRLLIRVIRQYPRHSLAAGASLLILGGIFYTQSAAPKNRRDLTNAISGNGNGSPTATGTKTEEAATKPTADSETKLAGESQTAAAEREKLAASAPAGPAKSDIADTSTAQAKSVTPPALPALAQPESPGPAPAPSSSLAQADSSKKDEPKPELQLPQPEPPPHAVASADHPGSPLPAPPRESAKATLLPAPVPVEAPAPASALARDEKHGAALAGDPSAVASPAPPPKPAGTGDAASKKDSNKDVPSDLWLPETAPNAGDDKTKDDKPKDARTEDSVVAGLPAGEHRSIDESKKPDETTPGAAAPVDKLPQTQTMNHQKSADENPLPVQVPAPAETPSVTLPEDNHAAEAARADDGTKPDEKTSRATNEGDSNRIDPGAALPVSAEAGSSHATAENAKDKSALAHGSEPIVRPESDSNETSGVAGRSTATDTRRPTESKTASDAKPTVSEDGWISVPNSGKVPVDPTESSGGESGDAASGDRAGATAARGGGTGSSFHSSRDMDFEPEPTQPRRFDAGTAGSSGRPARAGAGSALNPQPRAASHSERVEATEHVVERGENFWTISRQYWGSGRYYRALWKANEARCPDIKGLRVGDVIVVPAVEDLDPDFILQPTRASAPAESLTAAGSSRRGSRGSHAGSEADSDEESEISRPAGTRTSARVGLASSRTDNGAAHRAGSSRDELDLRDSEDDGQPGRRAPYKGRSSAAASSFDGDGAAEEPAARSAARPRTSSSAAATKPVYRVRPYDTLRSIARDMLGNAKRSDEILELNRSVIDDPSQLVVGQVLELPDDARSSIRRRAR